MRPIPLASLASPSSARRLPRGLLSAAVGLLLLAALPAALGAWGTNAVVPTWETPSTAWSSTGEAEGVKVNGNLVALHTGDWDDNVAETRICTLTPFVCTPHQLVIGSSSNRPDQGYGVNRVDDSTIVTCTNLDGTLLDTYFHVSTDAGQTFSAGTVANVANHLGGTPCAVDMAGSTALVAWVRAGSDVMVGRSTDGGQAFADVVVDTTDLSAQQGLQIEAADGQSFLLVYGAGATLRRCATADAGATWACGSLGVTVAGNVHVDLQHAGGTAFHACYVTGGTTVRYGYFASAGATPAFQDVAVGQTNVGDCSVDAAPGKLAVAWSRTDVGDTAVHARLAESTDGGATWGAPVDAGQFDTRGTSGGIVAMYTAGGDLAVASLVNADAPHSAYLWAVSSRDGTIAAPVPAPPTRFWGQVGVTGTWEAPSTTWSSRGEAEAEQVGPNTLALHIGDYDDGTSETRVCTIEPFGCVSHQLVTVPVRTIDQGFGVNGGGDGTVATCTHRNGSQDVVVHKSTDGGATFGPTVVAATGRTNLSPCALDLAGQALLVGWYNAANDVVVARSADGGATFLPPVTVDTTDGQVQNGFQIEAVSPTEFLLVYSSGTTLRRCHTVDAGATWQGCGAIASAGGTVHLDLQAAAGGAVHMCFTSGDSTVRYGHFASLAATPTFRVVKADDSDVADCDLAVGPDGRLGVAWSRTTISDTAVYARFAESTDGGATWTTAEDAGRTDTRNTSGGVGAMYGPSGRPAVASLVFSDPANEYQWHVSAPGGGAIGRWAMEGNGTAVADSSGFGNHGTLLNADPATAWVGSAAGLGQALALDGSDDQVTVPNSASLGHVTHVTVMGWARFDSFAAPVAGQHCGPSYLVSKGVNTAAGSYRLHSCSVGSGVDQRAHFGLNAATGLTNVYGQTALKPGVWYHLTGTYDGAQVRIFVNGTLDGTRSVAGTIGANTSPVVIGGHGLAGATYPLDGAVDEVRIYNRVLHESEIAEAAAGSTSGTPFTGSILSGTLPASATLTQAGSPYIVNGVVTVGSGRTLTIEKGVELRFDAAGALALGTTAGTDTAGTLRALGTAAEPIVLRGLDDAAWLGLRFRVGGASVLDHVTIEDTARPIYFDGSSSAAATFSNLTVTGLPGGSVAAVESIGPDITLRDSTFTGIPQFIATTGNVALANVDVTGTTANVAAATNSVLTLQGVRLNGDAPYVRGGFQQTLDDVLYNGVAPTFYDIAGGSMTATRTASTALPHRIMGTVTAASGATLHVPPGAEFVFYNGAALVLGNTAGTDSAGTLRALGTAAAPVRFHAPDGATWGGLRFRYVGGSVLDHVVIEDTSRAIYFDSSSTATATFSNLTVTGVAGATNAIVESTAAPVTIRDSTFTGAPLFLAGTSGAITLTNVEVTGPTASITAVGAITLTDVDLTGSTTNVAGATNSVLVLDGVRLNGDAPYVRGGFQQTLDDVLYNGVAPTFYDIAGGSMTATRTASTLMPHHIMGTVTVASGATLHVPPGAEFVFYNNAALVLGNTAGTDTAGTLRALGTAAAPIKFHAPDGATWSGLRFRYFGGSVLDHVVIEDTSRAIYFDGSSTATATFSNLTVTGVAGATNAIVESTAAPVTIRDSTFTGAPLFLAGTSGAITLTNVEVTGPTASITAVGAITLTDVDLTGSSTNIDGAINSVLVLNGVRLNGDAPYVRGGFQQTLNGVLLDGVAPAFYDIAGGSMTATRTASTLMPHHIMGTVTVASGATLHVPPGAEFVFYNNAALVLGNTAGTDTAGTLRALGTAAAPIKFHAPDGATWGGLRFRYFGGSVLDHVVIEDTARPIYFDGSSTATATFSNLTVVGLPSAANAAVESVSAPLTLRDSTFTDVAQFLAAGSGTVTLANVDVTGAAANLAFTGNADLRDVGLTGALTANVDGVTNSAMTLDDVRLAAPSARIRGGFQQTLHDVLVNGAPVREVQVVGGSMTGSRQAWPDLTYRILGTVTVSTGDTLTLPPATQLLFEDNTGLVLGVSSTSTGTLNALGTAAEPIRFGSADGEPGDWNGLSFVRGTSTLKNVTIEEAKTALTVASSSVLNLHNSSVGFATVRGLDLAGSGRVEAFGLDIHDSLQAVRCATGGVLHLTGGQLAGNQQGIALDACGTSTVNGVSFLGNASYALQVTNSATAANAELNYWGHPDGPSTLASPGRGEEAFGPVDFDPWLSAPGPAVRLPDLGLDGQEVTMSSPFIGGQDATMGLVVRNPTPEAAPASRLTVLQDGQLLANLSVPAIPAFDAAALSLTFQPPVAITDSGRFHLYEVRLDPLGEVSERNEGNNVVRRTFVTEATVAPTPILHDGLGLTFLPPASPPYPGQVAQLTGTVSYTFVHPPEPASGIDVTVVAEGIARTVKTDGFGEFTVPHIFSAAGTFTLNVTMTDGTFIDWADVPFTVQPVFPDGVDLSLTSLRLGGNAADGFVYPGDEASVLVTVANLGTDESTTPFQVEVFLDDQLLHSYTVGGLAGLGATLNLSSAFTISDSLVTESHRVWARVDGGNGAPGGGQVAEAREDNNEICGFRQVGCGDLDVVGNGGGGGGFSFDLGWGDWGSWQPGFHVGTARPNLRAFATVSDGQVVFGEPVAFATGVTAGSIGFDGSFTATTRLDGSTSVSGGGGLGPHDSVTVFAETKAYSTPGVHTVSIGVSSSVRESSTYDNSASASVRVFPDLPWLSVSGCVVLGDATWSGDDIVIRMTLTNNGGPDAVGVPYRIWYDDALVGNGTADVRGFGGMVDVRSAPQVVTGGTHTIRCVADPDHAVAQYDYDPARLQKSFSWTVVPRPDLTVTITDFDGPFVAGLGSTLGFRVANLGDAASPPTTVCVSGLGDAQQVSVPALEPGQEHLDSASGAFPSASFAHTVTLTVDCARAIPERREDNNVDQATVLVLALLPDLTVDIVDVLESDIHPGIAQFEPVGVRMRVTNIGFAPSPASALLHLQSELPGPQGVKVTALCGTGIPSLGRGEAWETMCTVRLPAGSQVLRAEVRDVGPQLSTLNDDDARDVTAQAPRIEIHASDLRFHPIQDPGAEFPANVTVRNVGGIIAYQLGVGLHVDDTRFGPTPAVASLPIGDLWPGDLAVRQGTLSEADQGLHIVKAKPTVTVVESGPWYATRGLLVGDPTGLPLVVTPWLMEGGEPLNDYLARTLPAYQPGEAVGYWRLYAVLTDEDGVEHRVPYNGAKVLVATSDPALPVQEAFSVQLFGRDGVLRAPFQVAAGGFAARLTDQVTVGGLAAPALRFDDLGVGGAAFWYNASVDGRAGSFRQTFDGERAAFVFGSISFDLGSVFGGGVGVGVGSEKAWHHRFDAVTEDGVLARGVALQRSSHGAQVAGEVGVSMGVPGVSLGTTVRTTETGGFESGTQSLIPDATTAEGLTLMELMATKGLIEAILEHPDGGWRDDWELEQLLMRIELEILARPGGLEVIGGEWGTYHKTETEVEVAVTLPIDFDIEVNSVHGTSLTGFSTTKLRVSDRVAAGFSESVRVSDRKGFTLDPLTGATAAYAETEMTSEVGGKWQALFWEHNGTRVERITTRLEWAPGATGAPAWWVQTVGYENVDRHDVAALGHDDLLGGAINPLVALTSVPVDWAAWGDVLSDVQITLRVPVCGPGVATDCMPASFAGLDLALGTPYEPLRLSLALDEVLDDGGIPVSYTVEAGRPTYRLVNDQTVSVAIGFEIPLLGLGASGEAELRALNHYLEETRAVLATGAFLGQAPVQAVGSGSMPEVPTMEDLVWNGFQHKRVLLTLASPADLLVTDPEGRRIGYLDGAYVNEIPGASSFRPLGGEHEQYLLPHGPQYAVQVIGTGEGDYHLTMASLGAGENNITYLETATINGTTDLVVYDSGTGDAVVTPEVPRPGLFRLMEREGNVTANATGSMTLGGAQPALRLLAASPDPAADALTGDRFLAGFAYAAGAADGPATVRLRYPGHDLALGPQARILVDGSWQRVAPAGLDAANRTATFLLAGPATVAIFLDGPDTVPEAPAGVATQRGVRSVTVTWQPGPDGGAPILGYAVLRDGEPLATLPASQTSLVDTDVLDGQAWTYQVLARNDEGVGPASAGVTGQAFALPSAPPAPAAVPGPGKGEVRLTWQAPADDGGTPVTSYVVHGGDAGGPLAPLGTVTEPAFVDGGLGNDRARSYAVVAVNAAGAGPLSEPAGARTFALPSAPLGMAGSSGPGANEATLSWQPPAQDGGSPVTGYVLHRVGKGTSVALPAGQLSFTDGGLADGETAGYAVAAVTVAGEGPASAVANATAFDVPGAPAGLTATGTVRKVTLAWSAPASDGGTPVTGYAVYGAESGRPMALLGTTAADVATFEHAGLANGLRYEYRVAATNLAGEGPPSDTVAASTFGLPAPPVMRPPVSTVHQNDLGWTAPADGGTPILRYVLQKGTSTADASFVAEAEPAGTGHVDADVPAGRTFYYRVAAVNAAGQGPWSAALGARAYAGLVDIPAMAVPPSGKVATLSVCESGTPGCLPLVPGLLCVQLAVGDGRANPLACAERSALPPEAYPTLRDLPDAVVTVPAAGQPAALVAPSVQVWYDYLGTRLVDDGLVCRPFSTSQSGVQYVLDRPQSTELRLRVDTVPGGTPQVHEERVVDHLGQIVAAAQATAGVIPCG